MEIPEQGEQSGDAASVSQWCEAIFRISGLDLVARTVDQEEEISVEIFGPDIGTIAEASDYLDSLQVLANKAFTGRSVERRIEFDAAGFKQRREEELAEQAREVADQVRKEGRERTLRAMSPIERRIVHLALEDDRSVTTESRGRGFHKRVAILPADEEQPVAEES
jgi:spoIIIJ-associated protein